LLCFKRIVRWYAWVFKFLKTRWQAHELWACRTMVIHSFPPRPLVAVTAMVSRAITVDGGFSTVILTDISVSGYQV
jgi:hypothetical protein